MKRTGKGLRNIEGREITPEKIEETIKRFEKEYKEKLDIGFHPNAFGKYNGAYHLGGNLWTGKQGWEDFCVLLEKEAKKYIKEDE